MSELEQLQRLYENIHQCTKCYNSAGCKIKPDSNRVQRVAIQDTLASKIFLVGQALGEETQRLSGIPYTWPRSFELSVAGRKLQKHLDRLGYCIPHHYGSDGRRMVYSSDIVQCWPGFERSRNRDDKPTRQEICNCSSWLLSEIELVRPRIVVLLGRIAANVFFERHLGQKVKRLGTVLHDEYPMDINGLSVYAYVLPHPAAPYPHFNLVYRYTLNSIRDRLSSC
jgi:uracil-DNA glycosylase